MDRPRLTRMLGDLQVTVEQLPPRRGMRAALQAARVLGPTLEAMLLGTPIELGPYRLTPAQVGELFAAKGTREVQAAMLVEGEWKATAVSIATHPVLAGAGLELARRLLQTFERLEPAEACELADDLLVGVTTIGEPGQPGAQRIMKAEQLDQYLPDAVTLVGAVRMGVELNLRPFVIASATAVGSFTART